MSAAGDPVAHEASLGAEHIAHEVGLAASTVQSILNRARLRRLGRGDRASASEPVRRYQRDRLGELVHVGVKKLVDTTGGVGCLLLAHSDDATMWTLADMPYVLNGSADDWDAAIYRATGQFGDDGSMDPWYSARSAAGLWRIGRSFVSSMLFN